MNEVEKDQSVGQDEEKGSDGLGGIVFDSKDEMIDDLAEAILNRIFSDERFGALKRQSDFKQVDEKDSRRRSRSNSRGEIQNPTNQFILLRELVPNNNKTLDMSIKQHKWAKEYLQVIEILYEELRVEYTDFPFKPIKGNVDSLFSIIRESRSSNTSRRRGGDSWYQLIMRIEVFMLALLYQPTPAFIFFGTTGKRVREETPLRLSERITRLGLELLFLWQNKNDIKLLEFNYLTRNVKVLVDFFKELEPSVGEKTTFTLEQDLTLDSLKALDSLLMELKSFAESGRYKKNLPQRIKSRVREGDAEPITVIVKPNRIEMTVDWKRRSKQLQEAILYFQKYKCQSILLYRVQISLSLVSGSVTVDQFLKLFGVFNKKAKKPNGLKGYSDFLYFWKEDFGTQNIILDLVCVFKAEALMQQTENDGEQVYKYRNIRLDLQNYFQQVLDEQSEIFEGRKVSLQFEPTPILQNSSYGLTPEFLIELGDKTKWKIFEQKVLPYFIFMEFFDVNYSDEIKNRFKRGQAS